MAFHVLTCYLFLQACLATPVYESIEDLVDGFRRQQMFISTNLLNETSRLKLPEKLAQAEAEEAEQRFMVAYRAKNEAKIPFIATSSRLNLGYIGRGYDIYYGNPLSDTGDIDQGFRLPVIDLPFSFRFSTDGEYRLPDNVDVESEPSASFGSYFYETKTETDYRSMLQEDTSVEANIGGSFMGFGASASFSASNSYKKAVKDITRGESTKLNVIGRANVYKARLSSRGTLSKLSAFLEDAITSLPIENCETRSIQQLYISQIIQKFGTHYTTEVTMGAKAVQEMRFKKSDLDRFRSFGMSSKVAASFSVGFTGKSGGINAGGGSSFGTSNSESLRQMVEETEKEQREYYIGGSPPSGDYSKGSTESLREWARSASENPAPIQYKIASIDSVLKAQYFSNPTAGLFERRKCLRKALMTYCMETVTAKYCEPLSDATVTGAIKYGDFITLKHTKTGRYLALSEDYGVIPGNTIQPLKSVPQMSNYDALFQITPLDTEKYGYDLHYGEVFNLKSKKGEEFYMGKPTILSDKNYYYSRLFDIMAGTHSDVSVSIDVNPISQFSIFLKQSKLCSYVVSVYLHCYNTAKFDLQVDLKGENGSFSTIIDANCQKGKKEWFHSITIDLEFGHILEFNNLQYSWYRGSLRPYFFKEQLQIHSLINGERRTIDWEHQHNNGNDKLGTTVEKINPVTYPIQFAFHSTSQSHLLGQPVNPKDNGIIKLLSAMEKSTFWDEEVTHLINTDGTGAVGISEIAPASQRHRRKRSVDSCYDVIFPSTVVPNQRYDRQDHIILSFGIHVKIALLEITTNSSKVADIGVSLLGNTGNTSASSKTNTDGGNVIVSYNFNQVEAVGLQIFYKGTITDTDVTTIIDSIQIRGCVASTADQTIENLVWEIERSDLELISYPYIKLAPNPKANDDDIVIIDKSVTVTKHYSFYLSQEMANCTISEDKLKIFLETSINTGGLQFEDIQVQKSEDLEFRVSIKITALSYDEFERGSMALKATLSRGIEDQSCGTQGQFYSGRQENKAQNESTGLTFTVEQVILILIAVVVVLALLAFLLVLCQIKQRLEIRGYEEQPSIRKRPRCMDSETNTERDIECRDEVRRPFVHVDRETNSRPVTLECSTSASHRQREDEGHNSRDKRWNWNYYLKENTSF